MEEADKIHETYCKLASAWAALDESARNLHLDAFPLSFSYNSGRIENEGITLHDTQEVFDKGRVVSFTGDTRTIFEIVNLKNAWPKMLGFATASNFMAIDDLLDLHRVLTMGTYDDERWAKGERPGSFKKGDYVVGANEVGYRAAEVPVAIGELFLELGEWDADAVGTSAERVLAASCYAHAKLVDIHPFADGNGRVARALQNIILLRHSCLPVCVDERDRMSYFGALDAFHADGSLDEFVLFCEAECVKGWADRLLA